MQFNRVIYATKLFPKLKSPLGYSSDISANRSCNRDLLQYFGFISDVIGASTFAQLPSFRRSLKKLINLVESELSSLGSQEVLLPTIVPQRLWHNSDRVKRDPKCFDSVFKLIDDDDRKLLLGPTFEESITHLIKHIDGSISEQELPILLHQSSPKFRLESNPKFGIIRSNEFFMNDLYSFDADLERAKKTYESVCLAYDNIFRKLGLPCIKTEGSPGNIGGKYSHEYQLPVKCGQDIVIKCDNCSHAANLELEDRFECVKCGSNQIQKLTTIELAHTFLLSDTYSRPMDAKLTRADGSRMHYEMGCYGLGLTRMIGAGIELMTIRPPIGAEVEQQRQMCQLRWPKNIEPYDIGLIPPAKRSKQFNAGSSQFVDRFVSYIVERTKQTDVLVEDRDKEGIGRRLIRLKSLGIPYIIVVGQNFLDDLQQFELFQLDADRQDYEVTLLTEDQLLDFISQRVDKIR